MKTAETFKRINFFEKKILPRCDFGKELLKSFWIHIFATYHKKRNLTTAPKTMVRSQFFWGSGFLKMATGMATETFLSCSMHVKIISETSNIHHASITIENNMISHAIFSFWWARSVQHTDRENNRNWHASHTWRCWFAINTHIHACVHDYIIYNIRIMNMKTLIVLNHYTVHTSCLCVPLFVPLCGPMHHTCTHAHMHTHNTHTHAQHTHMLSHTHMHTHAHIYMFTA